MLCYLIIATAGGYNFVTDMITNSWTLRYRVVYPRKTWQVKKLYMIVNYIIYANVRIHTFAMSLDVMYILGLLHYWYLALDIGKWHTS